MTVHDLASYENLVGYLLKNGWQRESPGPAGSMWHWGVSGARVPVIAELSSSDYEWSTTIERIAHAMQQTTEAVSSAVGRMYFDVQSFRAADDVYIQGSIPVESGYNLFWTARSLIRAAAATARSNKMRIGNNYGAGAIRVAEKARFGHTVAGSYIVPLLMPLGRPAEETDATLPLRTPLATTQPFIETEERRTTRTLAQALSAVQHGVIEPAKAPGGSIVSDLVATGVSREMLIALERMVGSEGVSEFEVSFDWAGAFDAPPGNLTKVTIPHDSIELLRLTAEKMVTPPRQPLETLSGQIIDLEDDPDAPGGRATLRVFRRGRQIRLDVRLDQVETNKAHEWFQAHRHVLVSGTVKSFPGRSSVVETPDQFAPLDEVVLFSDAGRDRE